MREIINHLPILKAGVSKDNYPLYAQLLHSEDGYVSTCNDSSYIRLKFDMGFQGDVNIFVLEDMLKILPDEHMTVIEDGAINIRTSKLDHKLKLVPMNFFPSMELPEITYTEIDEGILDLLKTALGFTGSNEYESVYLDGEGLLSTNGQKVLKYDGPTFLMKPIMLSRKIISLLQAGYLIGSDENDNTVVKFPNGFGVFVSPHYSSYPSEHMRNYISPLLLGTKKLVNVGEFKEQLGKVLPIFFGEGKRLVELKNDGNGSLTIKGQSPYNGVASVVMYSDLSYVFDMTIDADLFGAVPNEYDLHVKGDINNRLMAKNHSAEVVLMGVD